jgi:hypothetical protein
MLPVLPYPRPRSNRIGGESSAAAIGYTFPRSRVMSFNMSHATSGSRQTMSLGSCQGPAIIKSIRLKWASAVDPPRTSLEIGYSRVAVLENLALSTVQRPYTLLTEVSDALGFIPFNTGEGILNTTYTTDILPGNVELNLVVNEAQFFPVLSLWIGTAATFSIVGTLQVIENVDPRALASFL